MKSGGDMGIKRVVDTEFWTDEKVENFTPEDKYFWLYLLTNPFTKQLGIYHITKKQMSFHLGYDIETVTKLLKRFEEDYHLIKYIDSEIAILNYLKHSILKGGKPVEDCLIADLKAVKHKSLISWVFGSLKTDDVSETVRKVIEDWKERTKESNYINNDNDNDSIVDDSSTIRETDEFTEALKAFKEMRKKIKKPLTERAEEMLMTELNNLSSDPHIQAKILDQSTFYSWQGVYALKNKKEKTSEERYKQEWLNY